MSKLILLQGKARVGKSTIIDDLVKKGFTQIDCGDLFKCVQGMGFSNFRFSIQEKGRDLTFDYLKRYKKDLLWEYERIKSFDVDLTRNDSITLAELPRLVYPDIWAKGCFMFNDDFELGVGVAQDATERLYLQEYFDGEILDIQLHCSNRRTEDTRIMFNPADHPKMRSSSFYSFSYAIEETHHIADLIYNLAVKN